MSNYTLLPLGRMILTPLMRCPKPKACPCDALSRSSSSAIEIGPRNTSIFWQRRKLPISALYSGACTFRRSTTGQRSRAEENRRTRIRLDLFDTKNKSDLIGLRSNKLVMGENRSHCGQKSPKWDCLLLLCWSGGRAHNGTLLGMNSSSYGGASDVEERLYRRDSCRDARTSVADTRLRSAP